MAKQKRLNTSLVGFITAMAIIVVVSVAAVVIWQGTQRDPEVLAQNAREREQAGDLRKAAEFYNRAYIAGNEENVQYLLESARCWFELGDLGNWHFILQKAHSDQPKNLPLLAALLSGFDRVQQLNTRGLGPRWEQLRRDYARDYLELEPDNVLALVAQARALWNLRGEDNLAQGDAAAQQAFELAPTDPRAALARIRYRSRVVRDELADGRRTGTPQATLDKLSKDLAQERTAIMQEAVTANPQDVFLVTNYTDAVTDDIRRMVLDDKHDQALELLPPVEQVLERALAEHPDSPELHLAQGSYLRVKLAAEFPDVAPTDVPGRLAEVERHARRAVELEPAMYDAYALLADLKLLARTPDGETRLPPAERFDAAMDVYEQAAHDTVMLWKKNVRAQLNQGGRLRLLRRAFSTALGFLDERAEGVKRADVLVRARGFLEDAETKYPEEPGTFFMQGAFAVANNDPTEAIRAFEQANEKSQSLGIPPAQYWFFVAGTNRLPTEELASLYRDARQLGEAERYADRAIAQYERELGQAAPATLVLLRADLHTRLQQFQPALDLLERYRRIYPDEQRLLTARAMVLSRLGRGEQALSELPEFTESELALHLREYQVAIFQSDFDAAEQALRTVLDHPDARDDQRQYARQKLVDTQLQRARDAAGNDDYQAAEQILRQVLREPDAGDQQTRQALTLFAGVMTQTEQRAAARAFFQELLDSQQSAGLTRVLQKYVTLFSEDDPAERDRQFLNLISQNPDAQGRALEYYSFYINRDDYAEAVKYLAELRELDPDNPVYLEREFRVRLRMRDMDGAAKLLVTLSQYDEGRGLDRVGGATYRGEFELHKGTREGATAAVSEFSQAVRELPKSARLQVSLARAYLGSGQTRQGIEALEEAIAISPRNMDAYDWLIRACEQRANSSFGAERAEYENKSDEHLAAAERVNPQHPMVVEARQRARERVSPLEAIRTCEQRWAEDPNDLANVAKLGQLYERAYTQLDDPSGPAADELRGKALELFQKAVPAASGNPQLILARTAASFCALSGQTQEGEALLQDVLEEQTGPGRVKTQLLLAAFYENSGVPDSAERAYQAAQRLVAQSAQDPAERRELDRLVGLSLIEFYGGQQRPGQVVEVCRWMLDRPGSEGADAKSIRLKLIEALQSAKRLADAETELDLYQRTYGADDVAGLLHRAQLHLLRNEPFEAERNVAAVLKQNPQHAWALFTHGRLALRRGNYEVARANLLAARELVSGTPIEVAVRQQLAELYARMDQIDLAARELQDVLELLAESRGVILEKQRVVTRLVRLLYDRAQQFERAQQLISEYMEKNPDESLWPFELGKLFEARARTSEEQAERSAQRQEPAREQEHRATAKQSYGAAARYYQRAVDTAETKDVATLRHLLVAQMRTLTEAGRPRDAIAVFQNLPLPRPTPDIRVEAAKAFEALGAHTQAREEWRQALYEATGIGSAYGGTVLSAMREARPEEAEPMVRQVLQAQADDSPIKLRLQLLLAGQLAEGGEPKSALPAVNAVLKQVTPGMHEHLEALLMQAQVLTAAREPAAALATYREVLQTYENNIVALNNLAYALVTLEGDAYRPQEAKVYADRLWRLVAGTPTAGVVLDTVGWVFYKNGEYELAAAALEEAFGAGGDDNPTVYLHLGKAYVALKRTARARQLLEQGLELARQDDDEDSRKLAEQLEEELANLR